MFVSSFTELHARGWAQRGVSRGEGRGIIWGPSGFQVQRIQRQFSQEAHKSPLSTEAVVLSTKGKEWSVMKKSVSRKNPPPGLGHYTCLSGGNIGSGTQRGGQPSQQLAGGGTPGKNSRAAEVTKSRRVGGRGGRAVAVSACSW